MKKILYITNQICGPGGLERVLSVKTSYLIDTFGYEIHILTLNQGDEPIFYDFNKKIIYHDITTKGSLLKYFITYVRGLQKKAKEINPDIILVCDDGLKGFFVPLILSKPCPMIYERHVSKLIEQNHRHQSFSNTIKTKVKYSFMNIGAKSYNKFVVLTEGNKKEWNLKNLEVISNPLPFYPAESSNLNLKRIIAVGKLSPQKGYDLLIEAWVKVIKKHPDWKLEIFGKGNDYNLLNSLINKYKLQSNFIINKPTQNILEEYLSSSIYVLSSRFEGFGMVLIEAMACGVPCVSFNCHYGPSDIIKNNEDGFLVKNGDINALSEKICFLIENKKIKSEMGRKAKENVKRYLPENIVKQWDELFKSLIES